MSDYKYSSRAFRTQYFNNTYRNNFDDIFKVKKNKKIGDDKDKKEKILNNNNIKEV